MKIFGWHIVRDRDVATMRGKPITPGQLAAAVELVYKAGHRALSADYRLSADDAWAVHGHKFLNPDRVEFMRQHERLHFIYGQHP